ncbi:MAG: hypothetical protein AB1480_14120 [Nitrospirota bacterium]
MKVHWNSKGRITLCLLLLALCSMLFALCFILPDKASSGPYTDSAHGSSSYGVKRSATGFPTDYSQGNCAHCHEQHASIGGDEPAPDTGDAVGPDKYCLLANNFDTTVTVKPYAQDDNVCFYCHIVTGTYQSSVFYNYTYSITFGGNPDTTPNNIFDTFNSTSYHNLYDLFRFITGLSGSHSNFSNFPSDSNPCSGCHNIHIAKRSCGKPTGSYDDSKSALSKPSDHNNLWGDGTGEKMSNYTTSYQAPYWYGSATYYEPYSTNTTTDGSNLPDYVTFCIDCHNSTNTIYSTTLARNLRTIDWDYEKHGKGDADDSLCGDAPYPSGASGLGKVLSCLDCHEPHGAPNVVLIRKEVNGGTLSGISTIAAPSTECIPASATGNKEIAYLCDRCHKDDKEINSSCQEDHWYIIHHDNTGCNSDRPYNPMGCGSCHASGSGMGCTSDRSAINCNCCHYHGSSRTDCDYSPTTRRTF